MRKALGRGLEVLLPASPARSPAPVALAPVAEDAPAAGVPTARLGEIATNPDHPRRRSEPEAGGPRRLHRRHDLAAAPRRAAPSTASN